MIEKLGKRNLHKEFPTRTAAYLCKPDVLVYVTFARVHTNKP